MGPAAAGQPLLYTLAVTNHGPSASSAVTVHDTLPAGVSYSTSQAPARAAASPAGRAVTCQLGPLASGASAQVSITVAVAADATGTLRNVASVEGPEPDPNHANNESAVEGPSPRRRRPAARQPARRTPRRQDRRRVPSRGRPALPLPRHGQQPRRRGGEERARHRHPQRAGEDHRPPPPRRAPAVRPTPAAPPA